MFRIADQQGTPVTRDGHPLTELWESFTNSFAYDRFQWISLPRASRVDFRPFIQKPEAEGNSGAQADPTSFTVTNHDIPIYTTGEVVPFEGDAGLVPASNTSGPLVAIDDFRADARFTGIDGSGYAIAVLDTGIDLDDPFFGPDADGDGISDRIVYQYDFGDNDANASDYSGHGSNVTSIAASSDSTYTGMAPGADIVALKVFTDSGSGNFGYLEDALQWVIANAEAYNIVSVNMSITDGGNYDSPVQLYGIGDELATLAAMNIVVVSASGNSFYQVNSIQGVAYPSADPNSLSVGAVYEGSYGKFSYGSGAVAYSTGVDRITPFSQRDDELSDILAPGAPITGAGHGSGLVTMHGTSQAAPHIAGIIALAQELAVQTLGRKLTYDEITQLLVSSGDSIIDGDDENDNVTNTGQSFARVNVLALGEAILAMAGPEPVRDPTYFEVAAVQVSNPEGDSGSTSFKFTVTRSGDLTVADTIDYAVAGSGSDPANGADFASGSLPSGSITFDVGQTSRTVDIAVAGDTTFEGDEGFKLTIGNHPPNGVILVGSATTTIENDDPAPPATFVAIAAADAAQAEGDADTTAFTFTVTRSGDTSMAGTVDWAVSGAGVDGTDFAGGVLPAGTLSFLAGETSKTLTIAVAGDTVFEDDEAFTVTLSNPSAGSALTTASAGGTIFNDDPAPPATFVAIAAADAAQAEGDADTTAFTFTVTRSGDTSVAGTVDWAVSGAGVDGADFAGGVLPAGTLSFLAGEVSKTLTIAVAGDTVFEDDEAFTVTLSNPSAGSALTTASAGGTIFNDDPAPPATFVAIAAADAAQAEGDADTTAFTFTVTRSGDTSVAGTVDWAVSGAGVDGADFAGGVLPAGTLSFLAGETSKTLTIAVAGDTDFEDDEAFTVTLSNPSAGSALTTASAGGTILNDDPAPPATFVEIAAAEAAQAEGDADTTAFTFTVTRSGDTSVAGTVDWAVSGAGVDGADFAGGVLPAGTLSFLAGEVSKTLTIAVAGDTVFEDDEAFTVTLSNPAEGSEITTASAGGTILNDDTQAGVPEILIDANFDTPGDTGGFVYEDGSFGGANPQKYADGAWDNGALKIGLGGIDHAGTTDISGGWTTDFELTSESEVSLSFVYELVQSKMYEADEFSQVLVSIDGGAPILVDSLTGDGNGGPAHTTGTQTFTAMLGVLSAGNHSLTIGGFNNKKDHNTEFTDLTIDDVTLTATPNAPVETQVSFSAADEFLVEGDDATTLFTFTATRSGDLTQPGSVDYTVTGSGDLPADGTDFVNGDLPGGTVSFLAGEASTDIIIEVAGDTLFEGDETFTVTLSNLSDGSEIATAGGAILNDDAAPSGPLVLLETDFNSIGDTGGFVFSDGVFGGTASQAESEGNWSNGSLFIELGGRDNATATDMSGAWETDFTLADDMDVTLAFSYELNIGASYEPDEFSQLLVSMDGGAPILIDELIGDGNGGNDQTTGPQKLVLELGNLDAGIHSLAIGGYNNQKDHNNETTEIVIDDVLMTGTTPASAEAPDLAGLVNTYDPLSPVNLIPSGDELLSAAGF